MTYPITPNPAVHNEPSSVVAQQRQITVTQMQAMGQQMIEGITNAVLYFMTGGIVGAQAGSNSDDAMAHLQAWFTQMYGQLQSNLTNFSALVTSVGGTTFNDLTAWLQNLNVQATDAYNQIIDFLETGDWNDLSTAWNDLMRGLFGSSTSPGILSQIPATAVTNVTQSLQPVWDFPNASSIQSNSDWTFDSTHDHTGKTGSGSAKVIADGTLKTLNGTPANVQVGQVVAPQAYVMWSGLSATAGTQPIRLELVLSDGTVQTIASVTSPGAASAWTKLSGSYTVTSGITTVQMRLVVTANATAGTLNWDDCSDNVTGGFLADLNSDIFQIIGSFAPGGTAGQFVTGVQNLLSLFGLSSGSVGSTTDLAAFWTALINDIINPLNQLEVQANKIIGDIEISAIDGLASALSALLGTSTFQLLVDSVANALGHSGTGHSIAQIETYLGIIPPTNVTNVLGGSSLGADVSAVSTKANNGTAWVTRLTNNLLITSDVFHLTYAAGSPTDTPTTIWSGGGIGNGKRTWYSAWNDLLALTGVVNSATAPTDAAPAVATAITTAQTTATNAQTTLNTTNTNLFGSTTPGTQITTGAVPSGISAAKITNVLGGANLGVDVSTVNSSANTAGTNASTAITNAATAQATANNGTAWSTRLTNNLLITSDVFHLTYAAGSISDTPTTVWSGGGIGNGKRTWYSAWNDLLALAGVVNSTTAPTDAAPALATAINSAQTTAQGSLDAVNQGITGTSGTGATATQVQTTAAGLAATVAQVQSNVQTLQNAGDAVIGGVQIIDDGPGTTATDSGWGSNWTLNSGAHANLAKGFACTGGNVIGSYTGNSLNTDNMVAGIIFNALPNYNYFGTPADGARHRIKIRESADRSSCVFADIWHDKVQIGYRKTNTDTYIASTATSVTPAAGSNWELYGGNEAGTTPYVFKLLQNGVMASPVATWTDASHLSNLGSAYRGTGQDMYSDGTLLPGNTKFHARDLIQPVLKAMVAKHENTSTTTTALTGGSIYRMPVGWFSHQTYLAPGITMASTSGKAAYIVAQEGLYEFVFSIAVTSGITGSPYIIAPVIWVNTAPDSEGGAVISQNGLVGGLSISMCKSVYLYANDEIGPAVDLRAQQWSVYGEATGTATFMQLSKVG